MLRIVKFRISGYPGPSKDPNTEVRLMRDKIKYDAALCCLQLRFYSQTKWTVPLKTALMNWLFETWTR